MRKPKIPKQISFRSFLVGIFITILGLSCLFYVFAQTPSETFWISGGTYPGASEYTVWRDGSNYFAKNSGGQIMSSSTNATTVLQYAIDNANGEIFVQAATYLLTGTADYLLDFTDKSQIVFRGEGAAWPSGEPAGGGALPVGSTQSTLFVSPASYTGSIINFTMSTTRGQLTFRDFAVYGNVAHATVEGGTGCYGLYTGNVYAVNCRISNVAAINCLYGFYLGGSTIVVTDCLSVYNYYGYYVPTSGEYIQFENCESVYDYFTGFEIRGSGVNTLDNCISMPSSGDVHETDVGNAFYLVHPVGFLLQTNQFIVASGCQHYGVGTPYYMITGQNYASKIVLDSCGAYSFTYSPITPNFTAALQIYATQTASFIVDSCTFNDYANGVWLVKSETDSYIEIVNTDFANNTIPLNTTLLSGSRDGTLDIHHNPRFITENSGSVTGATGTTVTHTLSGTPTAIVLTCAEDPTGDFWTSAVGATTFTVNFDGGGSKTWWWYAEYKP